MAKQQYGDCIIQNEKGEILLLQRSYQDDFGPGKWCLPGGKIEEGETALEGAQRELYEETNLGAVLEGPIHIEKRSDSVSYYFQGVCNTFAPTLLDVEEHYRLQWVPLDEVADYDLLLDLKEILTKTINIPRLSESILNVDVYNVLDLFKRHEFVEASFNKGDMDSEQLFNSKEIFENYALSLCENQPKKNYKELIQRVLKRQGKSADFLEKGGKRAYLGEKREFGGRVHIKTLDGWKYFGSGTGSKAKEHAGDRVAKKVETSDEKYKRYDFERIKDLFDKDPLFTKFTASQKSSLLEDVDGLLSAGVGDESLLTEIKSTLDKTLFGEVEEIKESWKGSAEVKVKMPEVSDLDMDNAVSAGGSGGAMLATDPKTGKKYIVKKAIEGSDKNSLAQLEGEHLVDKIYDSLGVKTMLGEIKKDEYGVSYKITPYLDGAKELSAIRAVDRVLAKEALKKNFVLDCLLLNWDVIGAGEDNVIVKGGIPYRIDNGGSLLYRAKNGKKTSSSLVAEVSEIDVMRSDKNPATKKIFGDISEEEIERQAKEIYNNREKIAEILNSSTIQDKDQITSLLNERISWLKRKYVDKKVVEKEVEKKFVNVTEKWKNELDSSSFHGNEGIKEAIYEQVKRIERSRESTYKSYASRRGISVDEYKGLLQNHIEKIAKEASLFRATDLSVLDLVLGDRYKSQFETGTSHGSLSPSMRAEAEHEYFGFKNDKKHDKESRPIYGYCSNNPNGVQNSEGKHPPQNGASMYGNITVKLKDEVKNRATFMFGDSLGATDSRACVPLTNPHFTAFGMGSDPLNSVGDTKKISERYVEVQYHGQLKHSDIESIHLSTANIGYSEDSSYKAINKAIDIASKHSKKIVMYGTD